MANLTINFAGAKDLQAALERKASGIKRARDAMRRAVILVDRWIQKNFQTEGQLAYPGQGWQPLAPSTIEKRRRMPRVQRAAKRREKPPELATIRILQDVGWLRSRWRHYWDDRVGVVQSGVDYGVYHDSDEPRKKLPQRKILPREQQIMPQIMKIFGHFVKTNLKK